MWNRCASVSWRLAETEMHNSLGCGNGNSGNSGNSRRQKVTEQWTCIRSENCYESHKLRARLVPRLSNWPNALAWPLLGKGNGAKGELILAWRPRTAVCHAMCRDLWFYQSVRCNWTVTCYPARAQSPPPTALSLSLWPHSPVTCNL